MLFYEHLNAYGYFIVELTAENAKETIAKLPPHYSVAICDEGEFIVENNMQKMRFQKGQWAVLPSVMQSRYISDSPHSHAWLFGMNESFSLDVSSGIPADKYNDLFINTIRTIKNESELHIMTNIMRSTRDYDCMAHSAHSAEVVSLLMRSVVLMMVEIENRDHPMDEINGRHSMADVYFRDFLALIDKNVEREHEVTYYAHQLNITPKYLSEICKVKSQHKAKEIITGILAARIKGDILMGQLTMKALASKYHFADQSSLGKFFRKTVGVAPSDFRHVYHNNDKKKEKAALNPHGAETENS